MELKLSGHLLQFRPPVVRQREHGWKSVGPALLKHPPAGTGRIRLVDFTKQFDQENVKDISGSSLSEWACTSVELLSNLIGEGEAAYR